MGVYPVVAVELEERDRVIAQAQRTAAEVQQAVLWPQPPGNQVIEDILAHGPGAAVLAMVDLLQEGLVDGRALDVAGRSEVLALWPPPPKHQALEVLPAIRPGVVERDASHSLDGDLEPGRDLGEALSYLGLRLISHRESFGPFRAGEAS
jgi:hypothetical protein